MRVIKHDGIVDCYLSARTHEQMFEYTHCHLSDRRIAAELLKSRKQTRNLNGAHLAISATYITVRLPQL